MSETQVKSETPIYQLKVTLNDSKPPIWRQLLVPGDITLAHLHHLIQAAFGWYDCHLHQFIVREQYYSQPSFKLDEYMARVGDERRIRLDRLVSGEKFKFRYEYDFGDSWLHDILIEKILPPDPQMKLPVCIKGKRACPPEDVGGVWGYDSFLEAIKNPDHPEHAMYREWIGDDFDPEEFDLDAINRELGAKS
ncbi:MAG: plasmid pRiA4b ORF-3 family protein [Chloroflexota bacterium]|jgi:hypothetical protein